MPLDVAINEEWSKQFRSRVDLLPFMKEHHRWQSLIVVGHTSMELISAHLRKLSEMSGQEVDSPSLFIALKVLFIDGQGVQQKPFALPRFKADSLTKSVLLNMPISLVRYADIVSGTPNVEDLKLEGIMWLNPYLKTQ